MGGQAVDESVPWRLSVRSFPAQKAQDASSFCKAGGRKGPGTVWVMEGVGSVRMEVVGSAEGANGLIRKDRRRLTEGKGGEAEDLLSTLEAGLTL